MTKRTQDQKWEAILKWAGFKKITPEEWNQNLGKSLRWVYPNNIKMSLPPRPDLNNICKYIAPKFDLFGITAQQQIWLACVRLSEHTLFKFCRGKDPAEALIEAIYEVVK